MNPAGMVHARRDQRRRDGSKGLWTLACAAVRAGWDVADGRVVVERHSPPGIETVPAYAVQAAPGFIAFTAARGASGVAPPCRALTLGSGPARFQVRKCYSPPPYWVPKAGLPAGVNADLLRFPYTVTANDPETLWINVTTVRCDCRWYAELDWIDRSVVGHTDITDHGHPFETTAHGKLPAFGWASQQEAGSGPPYVRYTEPPVPDT